MIKGTARVHSELGIHARPAAAIASIVGKSNSDVILRFNDLEVDPGNFIKLMSLKPSHGDEVEIVAEGLDEEIVFKEIKSILETYA